MHQLISRPAVYLVIGIGVLALLVSQLRSPGNQVRTSVSELDPFSSLENLSGKNLALSPPTVETMAIPAISNQIGMVRDEMTSINSYQQTGAAILNSDTIEAQSVDEFIDVENLDSTIQMADIDAVKPQLPVANQIEPIDDSFATLELAEPIALDSEISGERYQLDNVVEEVVKTNTPNITPTALVEAPPTDAQPTIEAQPEAVFEPTKARVLKSNSMRPKGWRKNPFIVESNDVVETKPASEALEIETSQTLPNLDGLDSFSMDTISSTVESSQVSTAGNFATENAPSVVSVIPSVDQPIQSVVAAGHQTSINEQYNESLPIVIGLPDSVAHKAVHNIEYGKSLSRRGAAYAARQEFYSSLRILAQAHDTQAGGTASTRALRDAIIALKEAEDFIVSDTETQIGLNVSAVVEGHSTKLIPLAEAANMTAIGAMQRYFSFASTQLRVASGQNVVASEVLYSLGKLHTVQAKFGANASKLDVAKAIVFHRAAIASDRTNFRSANELGVLMANSGRLEESKDMLKRSLQIQQLPQAWKNLAVVHQRAGEQQLAQLAHQEFVISSRKNNPSMAGNLIRWLTPENFNQGTPLELRQGTTQPRQAQQPIPQQLPSKTTISQRIKSFF